MGCHGLSCPRINGDLKEVVVCVMYRVKLYCIELHQAGLGTLSVAERARVVEESTSAETDSTGWVYLVGGDRLELEVGFQGVIRAWIWRGIPIQYLRLSVGDT